MTSSGTADVVRSTDVTAEGAQVTHALAVPQERVAGQIPREVALPDDFAKVVQPGFSSGSLRGSEVAHVAVLPQERVRGRDSAFAAFGVALVYEPAGDLAAGIEHGHQGVWPAERAQVAHLAVLPDECPGLRDPARVTRAINGTEDRHRVTDAVVAESGHLAADR